MSSCQYGQVHPPYSNPPSVSSSFPPGAWITPSRVMNSETMSFLIGPSVVWLLSVSKTSNGALSFRQICRSFELERHEDAVRVGPVIGEWPAVSEARTLIEPLRHLEELL